MSESAVPAIAQPWRIALTGAVFCALFTVVAARLHHLQIEKGESLTELGDRQRMSKLKIQAPRGNLYDASGMPLAISDGRWSLYADPSYMDDRLRATVELSRLLDLPRADLRQQFQSRFNGRRIAKGLDDRQADDIRALKLAGLSLRREFLRIYPEGGLAPHVLGFVLADGHGGAGIEQVLDPGLYKAVIAVAPVTDLERLREDARDFSNFALVDRFVGKGPHVSAGSPARHAGRFAAPVMIFHGTMDQAVDVEQSRLMARRMKDAGKPVTYTEFAGLDHSLSDSDARTKMLVAVDGFLNAALKR